MLVIDSGEGIMKRKIAESFRGKANSYNGAVEISRCRVYHKMIDGYTLDGMWFPQNDYVPDVRLDESVVSQFEI